MSNDLDPKAEEVAWNEYYADKGSGPEGRSNRQAFRDAITAYLAALPPVTPVAGEGATMQPAEAIEMLEADLAALRKKPQATIKDQPKLMLDIERLIALIRTFAPPTSAGGEADSLPPFEVLADETVGQWAQGLGFARDYPSIQTLARECEYYRQGRALALAQPPTSSVGVKP
jgi:hypothetical protein